MEGEREPEIDKDVMNALVARMKQVLAGQGRYMQCAVLADLTAMCVAGHVCPGNREATDLVRVDVMRQHAELVRDLVPVEAEALDLYKITGIM